MAVEVEGREPQLQEIIARGVGQRMVGNVQHDEAAFAEVVPSLQAFAVGPLALVPTIRGGKAGEHFAQDAQCGGELAFDAQALVVAIEHGAGRHMHPGPPAVDFGFVIPVAAFGLGQVQRAAVDRAGSEPRRGDDFRTSDEFQHSLGQVGGCVRPEVEDGVQVGRQVVGERQRAIDEGGFDGILAKFLFGTLLQDRE